MPLLLFKGTMEYTPQCYEGIGSFILKYCKMSKTTEFRKELRSLHFLDKIKECELYHISRHTPLNPNSDSGLYIWNKKSDSLV